ncbi:MAG: sensor histidine kinase KdpD [Aphanocapsa lilacina HA4352-LM1]|jgi:two-component system sensor histidine kinase KdpD|nr:sensor histidine kinase KdpD [Aphanocapsa lilacina HA4352-LM1]
MPDRRLEFDVLLAQLQREQARGKLKVFFGAAAGVGKTCAMLRSARELQAGGLDVVVGHVETHGRAETADLLAGLERLPPRIVEYRKARLTEFDLDATLVRRPQLVLVDELAHTNAPGLRHPKRWQDIEDLLAEGIDVFTTVNVQHLESLNDVVAQITGVAVRETVPDRLIEQADEVELIDLPPDDLIERLKEGKIYSREQAERALAHFFRKGNLIALRELALRRTAERVDAQMQDWRRRNAIADTWPAAERILVCVSPSPLARRLVRAARRMAAGLRAEWLVVYVETPATLAAGEAARGRVNATLRLAEQLGAQAVTLSGQDPVEEILAFARERNVSKIVVGKPARPRWKEVLFGSVVDELVRRSGPIDVYVISGDAEEQRPQPKPSLSPGVDWSAYGFCLAVVFVCTLCGWAVFGRLAPVNIAMVYLLGVVVVATRHGRGPATLASVLSVAAFDFFFVPPHFTFAVADTQYVVTFGVMLTVALLISGLTDRVRLQAQTARSRERRTAALYGLSRELAAARDLETLAGAAGQHIGTVVSCDVAVLLPGADGTLASPLAQTGFFAPPNEQTTARWAYERGRAAGAHTDSLPGAGATYLPLVASRGTVGVLAVRAGEGIVRLADPEQFHLIETFASQTAAAIERVQLAEQADRARLQAETEAMRSALLSSVSHDLRTPLAVIAGMTSTLLAQTDPACDHQRAALQVVFGEAEHLNRLVGNLLEMTRLESGTLRVRKEWQPLEEVVGAAVRRVDAALADHPLTIALPPDLPLVPLDAVLIEQVLINLLENAARHTPAGTPVELSAHAADGQMIIVELADRGPGLPPGDSARLFEKFYRGQHPDGRGTGLGLAIVRGIVEAHSGWIKAIDRPGGGALFRFGLPLGGSAPQVEQEEER